MSLCPSPWHGDDAALSSVGRLCASCASGLIFDVWDTVVNYRALAEVHAPSSQGISEVVSTSAERKVPYSDIAGDLRVIIQRALERWAATVVSRRHLSAVVAGASVESLARIVVLHADWVAASPMYGPACVAEFRELARGEPLRVAFPAKISDARIERVVTCPVASCGAPMRAVLRRESSLRASEVVCTANAAHAWGSGRWLDLNPSADARISTAEAAIVVWGDDSTRSCDKVRQAVSRGRLTRGDDGLLSLAEAGAYGRSLRADSATVPP